MQRSQPLLAVVILGFVAATFGAALETGLSCGYAVSQYFGWQWGKYVKPRDAARFHVRVHHVIVSRRRTGSLLGYDRRDQQGPWLVRRIVRWLHRDLLIVPWEWVRISGDPGPRTLVVTGGTAR